MTLPKFKKKQIVYLLVGEGAIKCKIENVYKACNIWFYAIDLRNYYNNFKLEYVNEKYLSKTGICENNNEPMKVEEFIKLLEQHKEEL